MLKKTKILIIGYGSIGARHYRNLKTLGYDNVFVYDSDKSKFAGLSEKILPNISEKILRRFSVVFICNPNSEHIKTAIMSAKAGCHLFIEKPLSHSMPGVEKLISLCRKKKLINMVACNTRFHPSFQFIKKYISAGRLGKIYSIRHEFGYYLPYWRKGEDYKKNYATKKALGGGIILDDIHEFDLLFWLNNFSPISSGKIISGNSGALKIETEDQAAGVFLFKNGVLGTVQCDYLSKKYTRNCLIVAKAGNLSWDWDNNDVLLLTEGKPKKLFSIKNYNLNQMYLEELRYFLKCLDKKSNTFNDVREASKTLKVLLNRND